MDFLIDNWYVILAVVAFVISIITLVIEFCVLPTEEQIKKVKEWLLFAVTEAEKQLKEKTGQLKLRWVYDKFVERFGWLAKIVPFETFSKWVDEALEKMKHLLETNQAIAKYVSE